LGYAIAHLAAERRDIKRFSYGDLFTSDEPISQESDMIGFFVFSPSIIDRQTAKIDTTDKPIFLTGMYPIYREEIKLYNSISKQNEAAGMDRQPRGTERAVMFMRSLC
jgi:hypothetical protein